MMSEIKRVSSMTPAQARATDPMRTAWVGASAGTGKTHVLTARALRLMLTGTEPDHILCLTYTKAAAAEMKNRIFKELGRWSVMDDAKLASVIYSRTEEVADANMLTRARQLFARVLDLTGGLAVQTFHSFCQSLLGRFPLEAGLAPGFEGMEDIRANEIMADAKDRMLLSARELEELQKSIEDVSVLVTEQTFDEAIDRIKFLSGDIRRAQQSYGSFSGIIAALSRALDLEPDTSATDILASACADTAFDHAAIKALADDMAAGTKPEQDKAKIMHGFVAASIADRSALFEDYKLVYLTKENEPRARVANKGTLEKNPDHVDAIAKEASRLMFVQSRLDAASLISVTTSLLALGLAQISTYEGVKTAHGLLDFDDMITRTEHLLAQAGVAPWILFKLDQKIKHILVDEAQDTNRAQWQVVDAIAQEFYAGQGAVEDTRTIFAVGDAKQSIFSFQKADPREFLKAKERIFAQAAEADGLVDDIKLNLSFRSGEAVLKFVDTVFADGAMARQGLTESEGTIIHETHRTGHGGLVELWPLAESDDPPEMEDWTPPTQQITIKNGDVKIAERIADKIADMINSRTVLESKGRPVSAGDIMIILRRRSCQPLIVKALKARGIPVAGKDRMVLAEELPVLDMMAAARFALQPLDDLNLAALLKSPLIGLSEEDLFDLAYAREGSLWHALASKQQQYQSAYGDLVAILNMADVEQPFVFFSRLLVELDGRKKLAARLGNDIHDAIDELVAEALRFETDNPPSLQGFVARMEASTTEIKRDMEAVGNKVRIMTAHSSKGLQAPIVFLADIVGLPNTDKEGRVMLLDDPAGGPSLPIWSAGAKNSAIVKSLKADIKAKALSEYRRLLYVALTRAEDQLYLAGWKGRAGVSDDSWYTALLSAFEQLDDVVEMEDGTLRYHLPFTADQVKAAPETVFGAPQEEPTPEWLFKPAPEEAEPSQPLAPSKLLEDEPAPNSPLARRRETRFLRGRAMHSLLEWLPEMPAEGREAAARKFLAQPTHGLAEADIDTAWEEINRVITDPAFAALFGPGSMAEAQITGIVGNKVVSGQVDRLVELGDEVLVVDYKTNRPPPTDIAHVPPAYRQQMALYYHALTALYPGKRVRTALLWTDTATLMELDESVLNQALADMGVVAS